MQQGRFETIRTVAVAVSLAVIFRSFAYEPFHIPSGSMKDTLLIGDFIFVSKSSYGYSRYSFPLGLPLFEGRKLEFGRPQRGDIVVFRPPSMPRIDYIKRLIGLPGDTIQVRGGVLYINGGEVRRERVEDYIEQVPEGLASTRVHHVPKYRETLPNGVTYYVLDDIPMGEVDDTPLYKVPEGHYFFMGDNRDHSVDSRYLDKVGYVPAENLVGRAEVIAVSVKEDKSILKVWDWFDTFRPGRFWRGLRNAASAE